MKIESFEGNQVDVDCIGCAVEEGKIVHPGAILKTAHFDAHQDFEVPIPGFIIVSTRRHVLSVADFSDKELVEFVKIVKMVRKGTREVLNVKNHLLKQGGVIDK